MKRILKVIFTVPLILALALTPFISSNAYALEASVTSQDNNLQVNAKIQKDEAIEIAANKVKIPKEYTLESINFNSNYWDNPDKAVWILNYVHKENEKYLGNMSISIDSEDGTVLMIDSYSNSEKNSNYPPKVSIEEAKKIADDYIANSFPELSGKVQVDENYLNNYKPTLSGPIYYYFPYRYIINGIPLDNSNVYVNVDGNGKVYNFHYSYLDVETFEGIDGLISEDEVKAKYGDYMDLGLSYVFSYQSFYNYNETPFITYNSSMYLNSFDAKSGEIYYPYQNGVKFNEITYKPIVEEPLTSGKTDGKEFSQDEILKLADKYLAFLIKDEIKIDNISYNSNDYYTKAGAWNLSWHTGENEKQVYGNMTINAISGEIMSYYYDNYYLYTKEEKQEKPTLVLSYQEAEKLAVEAVKTLAPSKAHEVALQTKGAQNLYEGQESVYFYFPKLVHGIPSEKENIRVSINLVTGNIYDFGVQWGNVAYPEQIPELIPSDSAKELILEAIDLELVYTIPYNYNPYKTEEIKKEAKLIYKPTTSYAYSTFLDAVTGEWRYRDDGSLVNKIKPSDIDGHWSEKELQLMIDFKALELVDGKALPNQNITRGELVKMFLMAAYGGNYYPYVDYNSAATFSDVSKESPYYAYVEDAVRRNLITVDQTKEFNPEGEVSREELALFVVKALGYDKLASTEGLFNTFYQDQNESEYPGHLSIVTSLNIMKGDGKYFYPDQTVTRAVAAVTFYRYLEARNNYQENNQYYYYY